MGMRRKSIITGVFCAFLSSVAMAAPYIYIVDTQIAFPKPGNLYVMLSEINTSADAQAQGITVSEIELLVLKEMEPEVKSGKISLGDLNGEFLTRRKKKWIDENIIMPLARDRVAANFIVQNSTYAAAITYYTAKRAAIDAKLRDIQQRLIDSED